MVFSITNSQVHSSPKYFTSLEVSSHFHLHTTRYHALLHIAIYETRSSRAQYHSSQNFLCIINDPQDSFLYVWEDEENKRVIHAFTWLNLGFQALIHIWKIPRGGIIIVIHQIHLQYIFYFSLFSLLNGPYRVLISGRGWILLWCYDYFSTSIYEVSTTYF